MDLDALRGNVAALRGLAGPGVRVEPVVKADAYGHGAVPVALALEAAGVDGLSVATLDEAVELRDAGVAVPLLV
ncbi:MAG TPA: alanine racemase, partial [Candidatus Limnocylindrales bacterium]|nr:alanine racemase [Candidatus Limnocylindrales bacterium]